MPDSLEDFACGSMFQHPGSLQGLRALSVRVDEDRDNHEDDFNEMLFGLGASGDVETFSDGDSADGGYDRSSHMEGDAATSHSSPHQASTLLPLSFRSPSSFLLGRFSDSESRLSCASDALRFDPLMDLQNDKEQLILVTVSALNSDGSNPIHFATRADQARVFMKLGKHVDIRDADGATALHIAAKENAVDAAKIWLGDIEEIAEGSASDTNEDSSRVPLHSFASSAPPMEAAIFPISPNVKDEEQNTPLHVACIFGHLQMVRTLLQHGANINERNISRSTPLHMALRSHHMNVARELVESGAFLDTKDIYGKAPLDMAPPEERQRLQELSEEASRYQTVESSARGEFGGHRESRSFWLSMVELKLRFLPSFRSEEKHALFVVEVSRITGVERQASSPTLFGLTLTFAEGLPPAHLSFADEPTRSMWLRLIEARRHWLVSLTRNMGASGPSQLSSGDGSQSTFARMHQEILDSGNFSEWFEYTVASPLLVRRPLVTNADVAPISWSSTSGSGGVAGFLPAGPTNSRGRKSSPSLRSFPATTASSRPVAVSAATGAPPTASSVDALTTTPKWSTSNTSGSTSTSTSTSASASSSASSSAHTIPVGGDALTNGGASGADTHGSHFPVLVSPRTMDAGQDEVREAPPLRRKISALSMMFPPSGRLPDVPPVHVSPTHGRRATDAGESDHLPLPPPPPPPTSSQS